MTRTPHVRVSTIVATDPAESFEVFTCETRLWWRRDPRSRISSTVPGSVRFEPDGGGRGRVLEEFPGVRSSRSERSWCGSPGIAWSSSSEAAASIRPTVLRSR